MAEHSFFMVMHHNQQALLSKGIKFVFCLILFSKLWFSCSYIRCPNNGFIESFRRHPNVTFHLVDEYRTTKCCSRCGEISPPSTKRKDRQRDCKNFQKLFNRDTSAAENMVVKGLSSFYNFPMPPNMIRPVSLFFYSKFSINNYFYLRLVKLSLLKIARKKVMMATI